MTEAMRGAGVSIAQLVHEFTNGALASCALQRTIEWVDTDAAGHQHNSAIMRFVEATEAKLFRSAGAESYFAIAPRVRQEIDYSAKLYFGQEVTTAVRVEHVGTSSMTFGFIVWGHSHQGRNLCVAARGKFVTVCVPSGSDSSAPWPEEVMAVLDGGA